MLINQNSSPTWDKFFNDLQLRILDRIEGEIGNNFTPAKDQVLRFMENDLSEMKVCIIGQDPYYSVSKGKLVANGRAFQPNDLERWDQPFQQVSLKNMIRLIHKTHVQLENYEDIKKYKEIVEEINCGTFPIKQPKEWFLSLEKQGVLFLNRYLTTEIGKPNVHRKIWHTFVKDLIQFIDREQPQMIWFLWGNEAIQCSDYITNGTIYKSRHPMMCSQKYVDDFLKGNCFQETQSMINWLG